MGHCLSIFIPYMFFGISNIGVAVFTVLNMGTVTQICPGRVGMYAILNNATAMADIEFSSTGIDTFHLMVDPEVSIDTCNTVAHSFAVAGSSATHIPAFRQSIADRKHIAILQVYRRHCLSGIVGRIAHRVHPAGITGIIEFTEAAAGAAALIQTVSVNTAPQYSKRFSRTEARINSFQNFFFIRSGPGAFLQGIGTVACIHPFQIESPVQSTSVHAAPSKGLCCRAEGIACIFAHQCLCNHIGNRFVRKNIVFHRSHNPQSQNRHIHPDGGRTDLLTGISSLAHQCQLQLTEVTEGILGINVQNMLICIAFFRIFRYQIIFRTGSGRTDIGDLHLIQFDNQFRVHTICGDIIHHVSVGILTPGFHRQIGFGTVDDFLSILQVGFDSDVVFTPVLIGDIDGKQVFIAAIILRLDREGILSRFSAVQFQFDFSGGIQTHRPSATRLVAGNRRDVDRFRIRTYHGHPIFQKAVYQLVIIDVFRGSCLTVFTGHLPLYAAAIFVNGILHLQRHIICNVQNNFKGHPLTAYQRIDCNAIGIGTSAFQHSDGQSTTWIQHTAATFGSIAHTHDLATLGIITAKFHLIGNRTGGKLIVFDPGIH